MSKRFIEPNATKLVAHLRETGIDTNATIGPPSPHLCGGCADPSCCDQHPGTYMGKPMYDVNTAISGKKLHKIAASLGLVK
jgi:hypothetical protein